jgi:hypothetical protein
LEEKPLMPKAGEAKCWPVIEIRASAELTGANGLCVCEAVRGA